MHTWSRFFPSMLEVGSAPKKDEQKYKKKSLNSMLSDLRNKHDIQKLVIVYSKFLSKLVEKYLDNDIFFVASIQIHINFCMEYVVPVKTVRFSNNKHWINPDIKVLLREKKRALTRMS